MLLIVITLVLTGLTLASAVIAMLVGPKNKDKKPVKLVAYGLGFYYIGLVSYLLSWSVAFAEEVRMPFALFILEISLLFGGVVVAMGGALWIVVKSFRK